jgi:hypothetical protein
MISPAQIRVHELRRQDLLAAAARGRLIQSAAQTESTDRSRPAPRPLPRVRAYARYALGALAAVAFGLPTFN